MSAEDGRLNGYHEPTNGYAPAGAIDRMPPHSIEAERGVIGGILLDNEVLHELVAFLRPDDFFRDIHATLYRAIVELYGTGKPVDVVILAEDLIRRGEFKAIGGDETLARIIESVPHAANTLHYAQLIRQKSITRRLLDSANQMLREGYSNNFTAEQLLESAERAIFSIEEERSRGDTQTIGEILTACMDQIMRRGRGQVAGLSTGFPDIDDLNGGVSPGQLIILAARPSMGKTALGLAMAEHAARAGHRVLVVSLEMSNLDLGERLVVGRSLVCGHRVRTGRGLGADDYAKLMDAMNEMSALPLEIDDTPVRTCTQIAANARRLKARSGLALVVVDYIQLIDTMDLLDAASRQERVAAISRRLKALARELKVPVLALSQLNRQAESRDGHRPRMSDLRESGAIEQDADQVLLLHRPEYYDPNDSPGIAELIVAKNRNGATGTVKLAFLKQLARFENLARVEDLYPGAPAF